MAMRASSNAPIMAGLSERRQAGRAHACSREGRLFRALQKAGRLVQAAAGRNLSRLDFRKLQAGRPAAPKAPRPRKDALRPEDEFVRLGRDRLSVKAICRAVQGKLEVSVREYRR